MGLDWTNKVSAWHHASLHCREAPLPGGLLCPPENCGMCSLVMTLPWVHDSQPQPGSVWVQFASLNGSPFFMVLVSEVKQDKNL